MNQLEFDNNLLQSMVRFIKLAIDQTEQLEDTVVTLKKQAAVKELDQERYVLALRKVADALYDTDFLTDDTEKRVFVKKASEDPTYVVRFLEKVCNAADVASMGKPAKVRLPPKEAAYDPVMAKAFGWRPSSVLDD